MKEGDACACIDAAARLHAAVAGVGGGGGCARRVAKDDAMQLAEDEIAYAIERVRSLVEGEQLLAGRVRSARRPSGTVGAERHVPGMMQLGLHHVWRYDQLTDPFASVWRPLRGLVLRPRRAERGGELYAHAALRPGQLPRGTSEARPAQAAAAAVGEQE